MKVLVTGASSPLGEQLIEHLISARDVELVLGVDRDVGLSADPRLILHSTDLSHARRAHDLMWGAARDLGIATVVQLSTERLLPACSDHPTIRRFVFRSTAEVYARHPEMTELVDEDCALDFDRRSPRWVRERVEADVAVCTHAGDPLEIAVLRCAEILAPGVGSKLWDYLSRRVCFRPIAFDPMINVLSLQDAVEAFGAAATSSAVGVFNIPGFDTLPLTRAIAESMRIDIPIPARPRARFGGVLDGKRARDAFGYVPRTPVHWPRPWWRELLDRLVELRTESKPS